VSLRWRCLLLDHDDTSVDSTRDIHYPSHLESMRILRPDRTPVSLEGFFLASCDPGISDFLRVDIGFNDAELAEDGRIWRRNTRTANPRFYPGFLAILDEFRGRGGKVAVISHSESHVIERHYKAAAIAAPGAADGEGFMPDLIFGWDDDPARRKPSPWPVREALRAFSMEPEDALIVDDLKPGVLMGKAAGVVVAAAGWGHGIPAIRAYMRENCLAYLETVEDLKRLLFGDRD
jgi:beta-phosphoglucomutase-like phosphatase (HAD superfamily)